VALPELTSLLDALGQGAVGADYQANRVRTDHAGRLKQIAAQGLAQKRSLSDALASSGMIHSGVNFDLQNQVTGAQDAQVAGENQQFNDRLANIARQRIQDELGFSINSLLPR
jgi:hypothetical protein